MIVTRGLGIGRTQIPNRNLVLPIFFIITRGLGRYSLYSYNGSLSIGGFGRGNTLILPIPVPPIIPYHPISIPSSIGRDYDFFQFDRRRLLEDDEEVILISSLFRR